LNIQVVITDVAKILGGSFRFLEPPKHAWIKPWDGKPQISEFQIALTSEHVAGFG